MLTDACEELKMVRQRAGSTSRPRVKTGGKQAEVGRQSSVQKTQQQAAARARGRWAARSRDLANRQPAGASMRRGASRQADFREPVLCNLLETI